MQLSKATGETEIQNLSNDSPALSVTTLECPARTIAPGGSVTVKISVSVGRDAVEAKGVFIDLLDSEEVALKHVSTALSRLFRVSHRAMNETFRVAPPRARAAGETRVFEGRFQLPVNFQPTFSGRFSKHEWQIRARVETVDSDADSDFQPFRVGAGF